MAKAMIYTIEYPNDGSDFPEWIRTLSYGKCQVSPYAESELWFISIPHGKYIEWTAEGRDINHLLASPGGNKENTYQKIYPEQDMTFFVTEDHTRIDTFNQFRRDVEEWKKVAHKVFIGKWCAKYEQLWEEVPIHEFQLRKSSNAFKINMETGEVLKYGYCRTTKNQRDLWFVSFKDTNGDRDHTFIVDEVCATPDFMHYLETNPHNWEPVCYCYLRDEVEWNNLKTGLDVKDLERFQLDSPYSVDEIAQKIKFYQDEMSHQKRSATSSKKKKGWFS